MSELNLSYTGMLTVPTVPEHIVQPSFGCQPCLSYMSKFAHSSH